ncbi:hypothetical protein D9M71_699730 [compost metagenome]
MPGHYIGTQGRKRGDITRSREADRASLNYLADIPSVLVLAVYQHTHQLEAWVAQQLTHQFTANAAGVANDHSQGHLLSPYCICRAPTHREAQGSESELRISEDPGCLNRGLVGLPGLTVALAYRPTNAGARLLRKASTASRWSRVRYRAA